jgi:hypothetical protein
MVNSQLIQHQGSRILVYAAESLQMESGSDGRVIQHGSLKLMLLGRFVERKAARY